MNRKDIFMTGFKSKLGFAFTRKDMEEFETIIDFYEKENSLLKDKLKDIKTILKSNHDIEYIYMALCQYLKIYDYELDLNDYLKEKKEVNK